MQLSFVSVCLFHAVIIMVIHQNFRQIKNCHTACDGFVPKEMRFHMRQSNRVTTLYSLLLVEHGHRGRPLFLLIHQDFRMHFSSTALQTVVCNKKTIQNIGHYPSIQAFFHYIWRNAYWEVTQIFISFIYNKTYSFPLLFLKVVSEDWDFICCPIRTFFIKIIEEFCKHISYYLRALSQFWYIV